VPAQHSHSHPKPDEAGVTHSSDHAADELRNVNQRLLLAGLDAQAQAEDAQRGLTSLNALLDSLGDAVTIVDATGAVVLINRAARAIYGLPEWHAGGSETGGQLERCRADGTALPPEEWPINRVLRGEQFDDLELFLVGPGGMRLPLLATGNAIRDERGRVMLGIVVYHDMTAQHELERQKENFFTGIAHDLRTPLTTIQGFTQLLLRRLDRGEMLDATRIREDLGRIETTVRRMSVQIDGLLERHRGLVEPFPDRTAPLDLTALVARVVSEHQQTRENCSIDLWTDGGAIIGCWETSALERILSNLLSNAIKYGATGRKIEVSLRREGGTNGPHVALTVRDQGMGIPADDLPHIFERHFRASSVAEIDGFGIGLAAVNEAAARYGGSVSVESTSGRGTTFTVRLPLGIPPGA